jgi:UDP-glucose 4-epimerase
MRNIAITGGMGYIGSHLQQALQAFYEPQGGRLARCQVVDLQNGADILDFKLEHDTEVIFHLAAQTSVQDSIKDPMHDAMTNIAGTLKILLDNPEAKVIVAGSVAGRDPKSPYGVSKLAAELYTQVIHKRGIVLRLPNVFGNGDHGVVGRFLREPVVTVHGDGEQTRDFVHVEDVALAFLKAMDWEPGVYELSGRTVTINELAEATGKEIRRAEALPGEVRSVHMHNTTPDWRPAIDVLDFVRAHSK